MRDHNQGHENPPHREHPNFSPWDGDDVEEHEERPCGARLIACPRDGGET